MPPAGARAIRNPAVSCSLDPLHAALSEHRFFARFRFFRSLPGGRRGPRFANVRASLEGIDLAAAREGRYVREAIIGRGACAVVCRARDTALGRTVAIKLIRFDPSMSEDGRNEMAARSEREARAAGALSHPNIVTIHDAGRGPEPGEFQIVMEYVEGTTLRKRLTEGPLEPAEAARIAKQVAAALAYAHRAGIIHRDVKPANILIREDGLAKLTDFGIARLETSELTQTGDWIGSPAYMAPEQACGGHADARSDIFALGLVLYEMITGRRVFDGNTLAVLTYRIVNEMPPPPSRRAPGVSRGWDAVIMKSLAKDPEARYASAGDLAAEIERLERGEAPLALAAYEPPPDPDPREVPGRPCGEMAAGDAAAASGGATLLPVAESIRSVPASCVTTLLSRARAVASRGAILAGAAALAALLACLLTFGPLLGGSPKGTVRLQVEHGLGLATIMVEVDGETVWYDLLMEAGIEGGFRPFVREIGRFPPGRSATEIELSPGEHTIAVRVDSGEETWAGSTQRRLEPGSVETLHVRIRTGLKPGLVLEWE